MRRQEWQQERQEERRQERRQERVEEVARSQGLASGVGVAEVGVYAVVVGEVGSTPGG